MEVTQLSLFSFPEFYEDSNGDVLISEENFKSEGKFEFKLCDWDNIRKSVPKLYEEQLKDVLDAEMRFFDANQKGKLFTNATGTGKTLTALGIIKRFILMGKPNILIVVPTDQKCKDWVEEAQDLDIEIYQLEGVNDYKPGVIITTYANFYQNLRLLKHHQDLLVYDESHYLLQNAKGEQTVYLNKHKEIAKLPTVFKRRYYLDREYFETIGKERMQKEFEEYVNSTKVLFLSASPFAYVKSLILGDGTLWPIYETNTIDDLFNTEVSGYNEPDRLSKFYIENFGYRMRYNKLTVPETGVDLNLMERQFYEKFKKEGAISGRQIEVDKDYSREFVLLDSKIGDEIDRGLKIMASREFQDEYPLLSEYYKRKWRYHYTRQLLENIKANLVVPRIRKHLELNRKIVVFHDYNNSVLTHPFQFSAYSLINDKDEKEAGQVFGLHNEIQRFSQQYRHLTEIDLTDLLDPLTLFKKEFGETMVEFNGTIPKKRRSQYKAEFMDDNSFVNIILVQRKAGKEGISLHDMTGHKQRVLIELGLPTAPTDCIQVEGRIYRIGLKTNAVYEYQTIQTAFERHAYAETIAERSRTAENLSMGERARNMELIFKEGYQNPTEDDPCPEQGVGGKESDNSLDQISEYQKAISFYYSNQKKSQKTRAKEGRDYFATPEPLGYKMVQWLYALPNDKVLEPSAGHGAIARFFSPLTENLCIEPSLELSSRLKLNLEKGDVMIKSFEDHSIWNKYDKIVMNPPFGERSKLAAQHFAKAITKHLYSLEYRMNSFSRLIAILPAGESMNRYLERMNDDKDFKFFRVTHEILLPSCTFERAGTSVSCKVVVVDTIKSRPDLKNELFYAPNLIKQTDLRGCANIQEFFNEIEDMEIEDFNIKH